MEKNEIGKNERSIGINKINKKCEEQKNKKTKKNTNENDHNKLTRY